MVDVHSVRYLRKHSSFGSVRGVIKYALPFAVGVAAGRALVPRQVQERSESSSPPRRAGDAPVDRARRYSRGEYPGMYRQTAEALPRAIEVARQVSPRSAILRLQQESIREDGLY
jgi:hypothetical protein